MAILAYLAIYLGYASGIICTARQLYRVWRAGGSHQIHWTCNYRTVPVPNSFVVPVSFIMALFWPLAAAGTLTYLAITKGHPATEAEKLQRKSELDESIKKAERDLWRATEAAANAANAEVKDDWVTTAERPATRDAFSRVKSKKRAQWGSQ